jgi:hypothetical protein
MCRGDGTDELENIGTNQKDGGFWVEIKWERMVDSHFWADNEQQAARSIINGIKNDWGFLSAIKDVAPIDKTVIRLITEENNSENDLYLVVDVHRQEELESVVTELRKEFITYREDCFANSKLPKIRTLSEWFIHKLKDADVTVLSEIKSLSIWE